MITQILSDVWVYLIFLSNGLENPYKARFKLSELYVLSST